MTDSVNALLDQVGTVGNRTDLDLLVFFSRHAHALMTMERLAAAVGQDVTRLEASLQILIDAGLIVRTSHALLPTHIFAFEPAPEASLLALIQMASTRTGRLALLQALEHRSLPRERLDDV